MKMKILEINSANFGSTGGIMHQVADLARKRGDEVYTCCPNNRSNMVKKYPDEILFGIWALRKMGDKFSYHTGLHDFSHIIQTYCLLRVIKKVKPDLIHLHNLHGASLNLGILFRYLKSHNVKIVWTLHDCWSFTGHCPYFDMANCEKWKTKCHNCPSYREYPGCRVDDSQRMYKLKKQWFGGVKDMTLVAPSKWMEGLLPDSFLKEYRVAQISNGIDIDTFHPTDSDFKTKNHCEDKFLIIGVALSWGKRKGLDVFCELAKRLDSDKYRIVLVGTNDDIDKCLPENVISIHATRNQTELAEIYTAADVFVNPTREELFGLVNAEALACGTPVITFNSGGSPEVIDDTCGMVVERNDIDGMLNGIIKICGEKPFSSEACRKRAESFDKNLTFERYVDLYHGEF